MPALLAAVVVVEFVELEPVLGLVVGLLQSEFVDQLQRLFLGLVYRERFRIV